jgi:hypothetical protein
MRVLPSAACVVLAACSSVTTDPADPDGKSDQTTDAGTNAGTNADCKPATIPLAPAGTWVSGVATDPRRYQFIATAEVPNCSYEKIELELRASSRCTENPPWPTGCDPLARIARISRVDKGTTELLLLEGITSYGSSASFVEDVTDYQPALIGSHTFRIHVSTGSAPPTTTGDQAGFEIEADLVLTPGTPARQPVAVEALFFTHQFGPTTPPLTAKPTAPDEATSSRLTLFSTGHAADNVMKRTNVLTLDGAPALSQAPWRTCTMCTRVATTDCSAGYYCSENPTACPGAVETSYAGWCPAQRVEPFHVELGAAGLKGSHAYGFSIEGVTGYFLVGANVIYYR